MLFNCSWIYARRLVEDGELEAVAVAAVEGDTVATVDVVSAIAIAFAFVLVSGPK